MAKLNYKLYVPEYTGDFDDGFDLTVAKNGKSAVWQADESDAKIEVTGTKLADADEGDHFDGGKITGLKIYNSSEKVILDVTNLNINAKNLSNVFLEDGLFAALNLVTAGADTVIGTKKSDYLYSGAGNDTLSGKGGSDTFSFHAVDFSEMEKKSGERDVITDFETKGAGKDYLEIDFDDISKTSFINNKHDTQLTFDNGSTLVLEDVTKKEWNAYLDSMEM